MENLQTSPLGREVLPGCGGRRVEASNLSDRGDRAPPSLLCLGRIRRVGKRLTREFGWAELRTGERQEWDFGRGG